MKKLKEILLIDDSKGTNRLNKRLLEEMEVVDKITIALDGQLALDYLTTANDDGTYPNPDIIFLDINMPVLDGYQFLEEYQTMEKEKKSNHVIVMLTTSISEIDEDRAKNHKSVKGYQFKPLTKEKVNQVIEQFLL